jgi:hypothetical protein
MPAQVVLEPLLDELLDIVLRFPRSGQEDGRCCCLSALDPLGMVVGDLGEFLGFAQNRFQVVIGVPHRTDAHGCAVAPTVVGTGIRVICPSVKTASVSGIGIPVVKASQVLGIGSASQDAVRQGYGQNCVVCEMGIMGKELELLGLDVSPFVNRSNDVPGNGSDHVVSSISVRQGFGLVRYSGQQDVFRGIAAIALNDEFRPVVPVQTVLHEVFIGLRRVDNAGLGHISFKEPLPLLQIGRLKPEQFLVPDDVRGREDDMILCISKIRGWRKQANKPKFARRPVSVHGHIGYIFPVGPKLSKKIEIALPALVNVESHP